MPYQSTREYRYTLPSLQEKFNGPLRPVIVGTGWAAHRPPVRGGGPGRAPGRPIRGWYQRRNPPAYAGGGASMLRGMMPGYGAAPGTPGGAPPAGGGSLAIGKADYDAFERLLGEVQAAYGTEDLGALRNRVTPEMLAYFSEGLAANAGRGVGNRTSRAKLPPGDLAEAWRERGPGYATVAMRFSPIDQTIEPTSGALVDGAPTRPA